MKNFKSVRFFEGAIGYLSTVGMYGFWYPCSEYKTSILKEVNADHLTYWRNQDPYFAFKVPAGSVKTITENLKEDQMVCVWFHEKEILKNKMLLSNLKE